MKNHMKIILFIILDIKDILDITPVPSNEKYIDVIKKHGKLWNITLCLIRLMK